MVSKQIYGNEQHTIEKEKKDGGDEEKGSEEREREEIKR